VKKSKFSEEQIVRILKEIEAGAKVAETCRKHGISEPTYYAWKAKYAGMDVSQLQRLKTLCWRSPKTDHLCSLKIDQGMGPRGLPLGVAFDSRV